eukprot:TRINITY_DN7050_c0_g2_i2.p1 TRINITY_DN7050_c0_g2~~TRINITY_DN7050_c0_g2_i2.p1  ORF type:complete len:668 (+),score=207.12 TRINITY_DN7050_c0_g2_i2:171-2174(+)
MKEEDKARVITRAVVVGDSFKRRFKPMTNRIPKILMPVANIPIIEYLINYLSDNNIEEVYILCTEHRQLIDDYLKKQKYRSLRKIMVTTASCENALSVGAALRSLLDTFAGKPLISEDFIVLRGDIITNMTLDKAVKEHLERKSLNDKCMMTKTFVRMCYGNRLRTQEDDLLVLTDPKSKLIVQYQKLRGESKVQLKGFTIPSQSQLELRYDLYDTRIDICTPDLLYYLKDNFDCKELNEGFISDVNGVDSLVDSKVYYYEHTDPKSSYCGIIHNPLLYDYVNRDVIKRFAYPLVVDSNLMCPADNLSYKYSRNNIYMDKNIKLSMTCIISDNSVLGSDTEVHDQTIIENSVIGRRCNIGANVRISGSYVWSDVVIEDGCTITEAILCENVVVRKGASVPKGVILDKSVVVCPNKNVPMNVHVSLYTYSAKEKAYVEAGENSEGFERGTICELNKRDHLPDYQHIGGTPYYQLNPSQKEFMEEEDEPEAPEQPTSDNFISELKSTIERAVENNYSKENTKMEILSLRLSENKLPGECLYGLLPCILDQCFVGGAKDMKVVVGRIKKVIDEWKDLLKDFIHEPIDEDSVIEILEDYCKASPFLQSCFHLLLPPLNQEELISDEAVFRWKQKAEAESSTSPAVATMLKNALVFIKYLEEAEEESDDEPN